MRQLQVLLTKASWFVWFWGSQQCLSHLASSGIAAALILPSSLPGCHSQSWYLCQPWAQQRAVPAASSCAFTCLGWPWPLQLTPCGCSGAGVRGWTAAMAQAHTAGFVLGILGRTRVKKGKRKAFAFPEGKGGRARQQGQGSIQTKQQTLLLVLKMGMRNLAHPWLRDGLWLGFLAGVSEACGKMSWNSG